MERYARIVVVAVLVAMAVDEFFYAVKDWPLHDMDVYMGAAMRLRTGQPLYVPGDVAVDSFWYAPWFAVAWIPLTVLPRLVVAVLWSTVLLAASAAVTMMLATNDSDEKKNAAAEFGSLVKASQDAAHDYTAHRAALTGVPANLGAVFATKRRPSRMLRSVPPKIFARDSCPTPHASSIF